MPPVPDSVSEAALSVVGLSRALIQQYHAGKECVFWFIRADALRSLTPATLPKMQWIRAERPDWLVQLTIRFVDVCAGVYRGEYLVVSHRWEAPDEPDGTGVQALAVQQHLRDHPEIAYVWYGTSLASLHFALCHCTHTASSLCADFSCMPQGEKTEVERVETATMLPNINLLYLGCSVLILLDLSYLSRFWTQLEAYLSLRKISTRGLVDTPDNERRLTVRCLHNAPLDLERILIEMWATKTTDEAHDILAQPDVTVTNQSDKLAQLPKLFRLDALARHVFGRAGLPAAPPAVSTACAPADASLQVSASEDGATLDVASDGACEVFISLRFGEAMDEGLALQRSLRERGVRAFICNVAPGGNLHATIAAALDACHLTLILASETYGKATNDLFDTSKELAFVIAERKPVRAHSNCSKGPLSSRLTLRRFAHSSF